MSRIRAWWGSLSRAKVIVGAVAAVLVLVMSGCAGGDPAANETTNAAPSAAIASASLAATAIASGASGVQATPEPTTEPTQTTTPAPGAKPIVVKGSGTRKSKPFTMIGPATVDLTFTGSGNFITSIEPVGGGVFDGVNLSNTIGRTKLRTYVYDDALDGVRSYADVLASSGAWKITIKPGVPSAVPAPASFTGKWGLNSPLVQLAGDYTVTFSHAGSGNFIVGLVPLGGGVLDSQSVVNEIGKVKDSTEVYGLDGDYYFDVVADGAWTISIKLQ